jgi:hypothetical protein
MTSDDSSRETREGGGVRIDTRIGCCFGYEKE